MGTPPDDLPADVKTHYDALNKTPRYCTVCGRKLRSKPTLRGYNAYTGEPDTGAVLYCAPWGIQHDKWVMGYYGDWSNVSDGV